MTERTLVLTPERAGGYALALVIAVAALVAILTTVLPYGVDWDRHFRPATRLIWQGRNPYRGDLQFYIPPWTALALGPFAVAPVDVGRATTFLVAFVAYAWVAYRLGGSPLAVGLFMASPPVLHGLLNANIDWLVLLAILLPPPVGMLVALVKPQVGIGLAVYWGIDAWRERGWRGAVLVGGPVALAGLLSLVLYGLWPLRGLVAPGYTYNASLWPVGIPVGLGLLAFSLRARDPRWALAASPFLSPYVLFHSWCGALIALVHRPKWLGAFWIMLWGLVGFIATR